MIALGGTSEARESCDQTKSMIALGGQRFASAKLTKREGNARSA
jgi:hypothetical protein